MAAVKFASKCSKCETRVEVGTGDVRKGADGKWVITCESHKPAPATPKPRRVRVPSDRWFERENYYGAHFDAHGEYCGRY